MSIKNVALVGANGKLGPSLLNRLLSAGTFNVTVLTRKSSKSTYAPEVRVVHVTDSFPVDELTEVLRGQDAIVAAFGGSNVEEQFRMADAAVQAGVKRFIPADYGSCDSSSQAALDLVPLYVKKKQVREYLQSKEGAGDLSWTSLVCGHFFDWGMQEGFMHFDAKSKTAEILDDGNRKWSATTLDTIALAVVRVLQKPEETKNKMLYIQSVNTSQNEVLEVLKRVTGAENWKVEHLDSKEFIRSNKLKADAGDADAVEELVFAQGFLDGDWENRNDFANHLLGLEKEDLEQVVKRAIS